MPLVFSDCAPWKGPAASLEICLDCGLVSKTFFGDFKTHLKNHYASYQPYVQGLGAEQRVVVPGGTELIGSRSNVLVRSLVDKGWISLQGSHLDFGCGNGSLLTTLDALSEDLRLSGADIATHFVDQILAIPRVEGFLAPTDALDLSNEWDVIWMVHVLEHLNDPMGLLRDIRKALVLSSGKLVIQIPAYEWNPFDLIIADHLFHFTSETLTSILELAGFEIIFGPTQLIQREITCVARPGTLANYIRPSPDDASRSLVHSLRFLEEWVNLAGGVGSAASGLSIFGSSIAASWILELLMGLGWKSDRCRLLDDDESRWGGNLMGFPIGPRQAAPPTWPILIPLVPSSASTLASQLDQQGRKVFFVAEGGTAQLRFDGQVSNWEPE